LILGEIESQALKPFFFFSFFPFVFDPEGSNCFQNAFLEEKVCILMSAWVLGLNHSPLSF